MIIKNAEVYTEQGIFEKKDIYIENGKFVDYVPEDGQEVDASGCYAIPGLTDIHFHGCMGKDFCDGTEEAIQTIADYEASVGVTTIAPATMTFSEDKLMEIAKAAKAHKNDKGADLCGINMEGPFIAPKKKGAQNGKYIHRPDTEMFDRIQEASGGLFKLVDIAPEVEGAMEFIRAKKDEVVLSIAHTTTDYDTAKEAIEAGAHHVTHLYNAMNPINHREPGPIIAAADSGVCEAELICDGVHIHPAVVAHHVTHLYNAMNPINHREPGPIIAAADSGVCEAELICDGVHIHPAVVRSTLKLFGEDKVIFISDTMMPIIAAADSGVCEAELICDGVHIHPAVVRSTLKLFGEDKVIFISDTMMAAGLEDGMYELGGQPVIVKGNRATLEDGTLAGSNTNLMNCMRVAVQKMQVPLETAVRCAAVNPAKSIGIYDQYGSITPGKVANVVLLGKEELDTRAVILRGEKL